MFVFLPQKAEAGGVEGVCLSVLLEGLREVSAGLWSPGKQHFPKDSLRPGVSTGGDVWGRCLGTSVAVTTGVEWVGPEMLPNTPQCPGRPVSVLGQVGEVPHPEHTRLFFLPLPPQTHGWAWH